jgi:hypothetical protein
MTRSEAEKSAQRLTFSITCPEIYGLESVPSADRRGEVVRLLFSTLKPGIFDAKPALTGRGWHCQKPRRGEH